MNIILIAIGGCIGAICRYSISKKGNQEKLPFGTLLVNVIGAFLLGWLVGHHVHKYWLFLVGIGFCGALTTFSTLQWEAVNLYKQNCRKEMLFYLAITYVIGLVMGVIGFFIGKL